MNTQTNDLTKDPQVAALLKALEESGMAQERENVQALVDYVSSMEGKLSHMVEELQLMRQEVKELRDKSLAGRCASLVSYAERQIQQTWDTVQAIKNDFLRGCSNAVTAFRDKGRDALRQAIQDIKIPAAIKRLRDGFRNAAQSMENAAQQMDDLRERIHISEGYLKNAARTLSGRQAQETAQLEADKGALAKMRNVYQSLEKSFAAMEQEADALLEKLDPHRDVPEVTPETPPEKESIELTLEQANEKMERNDGNLDLRYTTIATLPDRLRVPGSLDLSHSQITSLPDNLTVGNSLRLFYCYGITSLPNGLTVGGNLDLSSTRVASLPEKMAVGHDLNLNFTSKITTLPDNLKLNGSLYLHSSGITSLPNGLTVPGTLDLSSTKITILPDKLTVGRDLIMIDSSITALPQNLKVGGTLDLSYTSKIMSLPDNLQVGRDLDLSYSQITSLPDGLTVNGNLDLRGTSITTLPANLHVGGKIYPESLQRTSTRQGLDSLVKQQKAAPARPAPVPSKMPALER